MIKENLKQNATSPREKEVTENTNHCAMLHGQQTVTDASRTSK